MSLTILYPQKVKKQYQKLPLQVRELVKEKEFIFRADPFDPSLKTHRLHGRLADCYAFSINYKYRIVFEFQNESTVVFHAIGGHDIY